MARRQLSDFPSFQVLFFWIGRLYSCARHTSTTTACRASGACRSRGRLRLARARQCSTLPPSLSSLVCPPAKSLLPMASAMTAAPPTPSTGAHPTPRCACAPTSSMPTTAAAYAASTLTTACAGASSAAVQCAHASAARQLTTTVWFAGGAQTAARAIAPRSSLPLAPANLCHLFHASVASGRKPPRQPRTPPPPHPPRLRHQPRTPPPPHPARLRHQRLSLPGFRAAGTRPGSSTNSFPPPSASRIWSQGGRTTCRDRPPGDARTRPSPKLGWSA